MRKQTNARLLGAVFAGVLSVATMPPFAGASSGGVDSLPPEIETLYSSGSYERAANLLEAATQQSPKDASLFYWLGRCYFETRDFEHSISSWERAIALDSTRSIYHDWLGRAYGQKADQDSHSNMAAALSLAKRTRHEFQVAVQLDARNIDAQRDLISFMASAPGSLGGGEDRALAQIRVLSSIDPLEAKLALADLYATRNKLDQASEEYQQILKSVPNRVDAYFATADYYRDRDDSEHMQQAVEGALKVTQSDRRLNYYVGVSRVLAQKDLGTAEKELHTYIGNVPDNSELPSHSSAYEYLGKLYEMEGRSDLAVQQYKAALAMDPENKSAREMLKKLSKQ
jgi:tetratricopeptide (TPR) repeat protein